MATKHPKLISEDQKEFSNEDLTSLIIQFDTRVTELLNGVDFLRMFK